LQQADKIRIESLAIKGLVGADNALKEQNLLQQLKDDCLDKKLMEWPTNSKSRRAQAPTPKEPEVDKECNKVLKTLLSIRGNKVEQLNDLLQQAAAGKCESTSRRLRRRAIKMKKGKRVLQAPTRVENCDVAQKAVLMGLANLTLNSSYLFQVFAAVIFTISAMLF